MYNYSLSTPILGIITTLSISDVTQLEKPENLHGFVFSLVPFSGQAEKGTETYLYM